ncbi:winged helix-turn-helix domain-containing protein [Solemya pervernicosa gill symbiont]|uniref:winged helix-turn-helix domain-containing protein n=1 Tax=Solemya pervernicosa gill symbiont TaxID=642797 RepID=UPI0022A98ACE|nr:winged helix-turn-helix domain-containing protein [Solemya pervernicosa gill symbiont]
MARVRSVLRRCNETNKDSTPSETTTLTFGPFSLDVQKHKLTKDHKEIPLTSGEFTLLRIFLEQANRVLNRDTLLELTKGYDHSPLDRSIDVCVGRLRKKIEIDPTEPVFLRTVWGAGYIFSQEE